MMLKYVQVIISFALIFQSIEYLILKNTFSEKGIWRWSEIKTEFSFLPLMIQNIFNSLLNDRSFNLLLLLRLAAALVFLFLPTFTLALFLFISTLLISLRFRGSFNGGSDFMALIILSALTIEAFFQTPKFSTGVLWYIAIQSATSYFIAGLVKIKQKDWLTGAAFKKFILSPNYNPPQLIRQVSQNNFIAISASWLVILFELSFPFILLQNQRTAGLWLLIGFSFHLMNFIIFGLNRFLIIWLATYPAIYFCVL